MGSVVVLNTCLFVVLLSNAREEGGGRGVPNNGKRSYITRQKESRLAAKGVPIDGKGVPSPPHKRSPLSLKEEPRWPPWDSVLSLMLGVELILACSRLHFGLREYISRAIRPNS